MMLVSQSVVSLNRWAVLLGILGNTCVAKQSLWERIHQGTVDFLQRVLAIVLGQQILPDTFSSVPKALRAFTRVLVQDSTTIKLSEKLAAVFPGSSNQFGVKNGQLKIQAIYDLLTQRFISFGLSGFTRNDQAAAGDVLTVLQAGDLVLRDLGYFVMESFQRITQAKAFFVSRMRLDTSVRDPHTSKALKLLNQLRRLGNLDRQVLLGTQKMPVRLVAIKLPPAVAAERRRKARQNRDRRCRPNATSLALLGWAIFITNVSSEVLDAQTVAKVYGLRWRIETIFKAWKSHFRITEVPPGSEFQLLSIIYARLIFVTVLAQVCSAGWLMPWRENLPPPRSLLRIAALVGDFFLILCLEAWNLKLTDALLLQFDYHGRYDRRARQNYPQLLAELS